MGLGLPAAAIVAVLGSTVAVAFAEEPQQSSSLLTSQISAVESQSNMSRSFSQRPALDEKLPAISEKPVSVGDKYVTADDLNIREEANEDADVVTDLKRSDKIAVTGESEGDFTEVIYKDEVVFATSKFLSDDKPKPKPKPEPEPKKESEPKEDSAPSGSSDAPCDTGSDVESGLQPNTIKVHRSVCAAFPSVSEYGGLAPRNNHATGNALDIMVRGATGDEIAAYVRENASELGVTEVMFEQRIWTTQRSGDGWRPMENRGGDTANHVDHVHVSTS